MYDLFDKEQPPVKEEPKPSKIKTFFNYIMKFIFIVLAIVAGLYLYDWSHTLF